MRETEELTITGVEWCFEEVVTRFGNGSKIDSPRPYLGSGVYRIIHWPGGRYGRDARSTRCPSQAVSNPLGAAAHGTLSHSPFHDYTFALRCGRSGMKPERSVGHVPFLRWRTIGTVEGLQGELRRSDP